MCICLVLLSIIAILCVYCQSEQCKERSKHFFDGDREKVLNWKKKYGSSEAVAQSPNDLSNFLRAIWSNEDETVSDILLTGSLERLSKPNKDGWLHLHEAACAGSLDCLRVLLQAFPELINKRTDRGQTPLLLAVSRNHLHCAQFLLASGGDPNIANKSGETSLYKACEKANEDMVELVLRSGGNYARGNLEGNTPLHEAVRVHSMRMCKMLVEAGVQIGTKNSYGIEPLFTAAQAGALDVLHFLIRNGGNINTEANDGATALYEASKNGHAEVVKLLLSKGANANKTTKAGLTPLHIASKNGHERVVLLLLPRTDRLVISFSGISPLHLAAERNRDEILELLIEAGFDVNKQLSFDYSQMYEDRRSTALYFSVRNSNVEAATMLLEAGADPNLDVFNPLLVAVRKGNIEMASLLVEKGANVNACMPTHPTSFPGVLLFCMRHKLMFKLLLDNGCSAKACFSCIHGSGTHPPVEVRRPNRGDLYLHGLDAPHTTTVQFCDVMADPTHTPWVGAIVDLLLDYVDQVKMCSRLTELLNRNKDWSYIKEKSKPPFTLMQLCRLRIRQQIGPNGLRGMTQLPLPPRLIRFLFYNNQEAEEFLRYGLD